MNEFLVGAFIGCIMGIFTATVCIDTYAESFRRAEAACVGLNSKVASFDAVHATCENSAVIAYKNLK